MKTEQLSLQIGVKKCGEDRKKSTRKEMKNLTEKNNCFAKLDYDQLTDEMKKKALPLLMFMIMKRNRLIKT